MTILCVQYCVYLFVIILVRISVEKDSIAIKAIFNCNMTFPPTLLEIAAYKANSVATKPAPAVGSGAWRRTHTNRIMRFYDDILNQLKFSL